MLPFVGKLVASKPYKHGNSVGLVTKDRHYLLEFLVLVPDIVREVVNTESWVLVQGELRPEPGSYLQKIAVITIERAP